MGLKQMQQELQQSRQQETSLITELTTALEQSKADNNQLQQQLQAQREENSNLRAELVQAYKQIQDLSSSDLQLKEAQQLRQNASADLENSKQIKKDAEQQKQQNEQNSRDLQSREQRLLKQQKQLNEQEKNLVATIGAYKKQAETDAKAALADGWRKLEDSKNEADKEREKVRQHAENLKKAAQRELESAKNAKAEAAERGYHDAVSIYALVIRVVLIFAVILGLIEVIKHWYIIGMYHYCYTEFKAAHGLFAAVAVAAPAVIIFFVAYFAPWSECDKYEYYLGLAIRLMLLIWLFAMADTVSIKTALITIYLSCIVVGIVRWMINQINR